MKVCVCQLQVALYLDLLHIHYEQSKSEKRFGIFDNNIHPNKGPEPFFLIHWKFKKFPSQLQNQWKPLKLRTKQALL